MIYIKKQDVYVASYKDIVLCNSRIENKSFKVVSVEEIKYKNDQISIMFTRHIALHTIIIICLCNQLFSSLIASSVVIIKM